MAAFAVLLPGTNLNDACGAAVRACEAIANCPFRHNEKELHLTISCGVAEVLGNEDGALLVTRADKALYAAKEGGRNCVYRHEGEAVARVAGNDDLVDAESKRQGRGGPAECVPGQDNTAGAIPAAAAVQRAPDHPPSVETDVAAGLSSRSTFCQLVRNRMAEWGRGGPTFSVVLIEADQYDQAGEHGGPQAREDAALAAKRFLVATVREMDTVSYYAPGCFALLLPTAGFTDAIQVAERLRQEFAPCSPWSRSEKPRPTLSVGVVQVTDKDDPISLLKRAEAALDAANRRGGNRAHCHDGERCAPVAAMLEAMAVDGKW